MEGLSTDKANPPEAMSTGGEEAASLPFTLSDGLALIPAKLVTKIQKGVFVAMAKLLRDNLEAIRRGALPDQTSLPNQPRRNRREVPDLLSWVQCFGTNYGGGCIETPGASQAAAGVPDSDHP